MQKDLTVGSPLPLIFKFSVPIFFGLLFQQFYSMCDAFIVERTVGMDAFTGVGLTGSLNFLVLGFVSGLATGFCIPISQAYGAKRFDDVRKFYAQALILTVIISLSLGGLVTFFLSDILHLLQTPSNYFQHAYNYIMPIFAGMIGVFLYNFLSSLMRALGDSKTPLYFLIFSSLLNIVLDLIFILVFEMGTFGAGLATALSQIISGLLCLFFVTKKISLLKTKKEDFTLNKEKSYKLLSIGIPMGLQFSITAIGSIIMTYSINGLDALYPTQLYPTAVATSSRIVMLTMQGLETLGITMANYTGQNVGASRIDRVKEGVKYALIIAVIYSIFCFGLIYFASDLLISIFLSSFDSILYTNINSYLLTNVTFYIFLGILLVLRNVIQGAGYSSLAMFVGIAEMLARAVVGLILVSFMGYNAVLYANPLAWVAAVVVLVFMYKGVIRNLQFRTSRF